MQGRDRQTDIITGVRACVRACVRAWLGMNANAMDARPCGRTRRRGVGGGDDRHRCVCHSPAFFM
jgi:hypothetical protein